MGTQPDDDLWAAIADPSRRRVLDLLVVRGDASASWLAGQVPFTRQAVSKHLVALEQAGLIVRRKQGREVLFQVDADRLDEATRAMAEVARRWDRRLGAIKGLAEATHARELAAVAEVQPAPSSTPPPVTKEPAHAEPTDRPGRGVGSRPPSPPGEGEGADEGP